MIGIVGGITLIPFILKILIGLLSDRVNLLKMGHRKPSIIHSPKPARVSDTNAEFFHTLSGVLRELVPDSLAVPLLTPGTTDSCFFRRKGVNSYGLFPAIIDPGELARFHGIDERISIDNLRLGTQILFEVLRKMSQ